MDWDVVLESSFGTSDLIFALSRDSEDLALTWLADLRAQKLVCPEVELKIQAFLFAGHDRRAMTTSASTRSSGS